MKIENEHEFENHDKFALMTIAKIKYRNNILPLAIHCMLYRIFFIFSVNIYRYRSYNPK